MPDSEGSALTGRLRACVARGPGGCASPSSAASGSRAATASTIARVLGEGLLAAAGDAGSCGTGSARAGAAASRSAARRSRGPRARAPAGAEWRSRPRRQADRRCRAGRASWRGSAWRSLDVGVLRAAAPRGELPGPRAQRGLQGSRPPRARRQAGHGRRGGARARRGPRDSSRARAVRIAERPTPSARVRSSQRGARWAAAGRLRSPRGSGPRVGRAKIVDNLVDHGRDDIPRSSCATGGMHHRLRRAEREPVGGNVRCRHRSST